MGSFFEMKYVGEFEYASVPVSAQRFFYARGPEDG